MQIIVLADEKQKAELTSKLLKEGDWIWIEEAEQFFQYKQADAFIDLTFLNESRRKVLLQQLLPKPVVVNSVVDTLQEIDSFFIRINGWTTFLSSPVIEAACYNEEAKQKAVEIFGLLNKKIEWLPDEPGFIAARVISMIVNEAFLALSEGVSTKDEIDTAMKLGTAYPYGPFEWAEKIGLQNIVTLLKKLSETQRRYLPAELLVQETLRT